MKLSALLQHRFMHGTSEVDLLPGLADLQQTAAANTGRYDKTVQAYSATLTGKVDGIEITSLSGYNSSRSTDSVDLTPIFDPTFANGYPIVDRFKTQKFSQELRLTSSVARVDWLLGGFYTHEKNDPAEQDILVTDTLSGSEIGVIADTSGPSTFTEYAGFLDLTFNITDQFNVQVGARESHNTQSYQSIDLGPPVTASPRVDTSDSAFTYLVTPQYKVSPDLMVYARFASGYRPGGPNTNVALFGISQQYGPDKTLNYELGVKGSVLDHKLSFDASAYYIDWKQIQIQLVADGQSYYANGSRAKSQGVELALESRPVTGLTLSGWVTWNDAVLTEPLPPSSTVLGSDGDRLPLSSRFSGNVSFEQSFPLVSQWLGYVGGTLSYVGERIGNFEPTAPRQVLPGYAKTDFRAGVRNDSWNVNLFADNVADRRGVLEGGLDNVNTAGYYYIQPRTIGLSLSKSF
jgi:iron complex outermembrane recepter protein